MLAAKPSEDRGRRRRASSSCSASTRSATSATCSSPSRRTRRCSSGSTAAPTSQGAAAGELRARADGAVHDRRRPLHRGRRLRRRRACSPAGTWRAPATPPTTSYYAFSLQRRPARHDGEDVHLPDLSRRRQDDSGARGGRRHAGRPRSDQRAGAATRRPAPRWRASSMSFFVSEIADAADERCVDSIARDLSAERLRHASRCVRAMLLVAGVLGSGDVLRALLVAGGVRGPRASRRSGWTGFSVDDALTPLVNMGQQLFEPPDVAGWDLGPGLVLDRRDAGAHELRVDARRQPEVQPARRPRAVARRRPRRCCRSCWSA